jgi:hypothetical protein
VACPCEARGVAPYETTTTKNVELVVVLVAAVLALVWWTKGQRAA